MIRFCWIATALALPAVAWAQSDTPITAAPLPPPSVQNPPAAQPDTPPPGGPQPVQMTWVPKGSAELQLLDKANTVSSVLTVKVGQQAQYGSLTIQVQACDVHPGDEPQDSAAYLTITDSHADAAGFRGWMLAGAPSISMLEHPIYDVRVVGCGA